MPPLRLPIDLPSRGTGDDRASSGLRLAGCAAATGSTIPSEFPVHPIFENCRRPTAALDRNLLYLGLVELLNGYPQPEIAYRLAEEPAPPVPASQTPWEELYREKTSLKGLPRHNH